MTAGLALGSAVPPFTPHAISVSLPTWKDNVDYEEGEKRVVNAMITGYPRFFIHLTIQKLADLCAQKFAAKNEQCMLFSTRGAGEACRSFIADRSSKKGATVTARLIELPVSSNISVSSGIIVDPQSTHTTPPFSALFIIIIPSESFSFAREFWQHTGAGISSRLADHFLTLLSPTEPAPPPSPTVVTKVGNRHYSKKSVSSATPKTSPHATLVKPNLIDDLTLDHNTYLEERYGRNLPINAAASAKRALRRRIAGVLVTCLSPETDCAGDVDAVLGPSNRDVPAVSEDDVFLYPGGMNAIWNAHQLLLSIRNPAKSVCFGFPYTDTLKVLQKWGPGCHFFGNGTDADIDQLEALLESESIQNPSVPPLLALFTEFPSNPLLRSADVQRLRSLADKYDFLIVIDETIGNFMNVQVHQYADLVVSSLSKVFSGSSNVMGGSLVLNPHSRHYATLKRHLEIGYEDAFFDEDAIFMERNSRDFQERIKVIDKNAEMICDFLWSHSLAGGNHDHGVVVKDVCYPKYTTREHYERYRRTGGGGGYGGLFSILFTSELASQTFFDTLNCFKGPSLGTNFTLACPFTILAHYAELEWAAGFGVEAGLVRVSVGLENSGELLATFEAALRAAETAARGLM